MSSYGELKEFLSANYPYALEAFFQARKDRREMMDSYRTGGAPKTPAMTPTERVRKHRARLKASPLSPDEAAARLVGRYIREKRFAAALAADKRSMDIPGYKWRNERLRLSLFEAVGDEVSAKALRIDIARSHVWWVERLDPQRVDGGQRHKDKMLSEAQAELDALTCGCN